MGRDPKKIDADHLLLCEGKSTLLVLGPFLRHHGIQGFQPFDFGGTHDFADFLADVTILPGFAERVKTVAIVRDAEAAAAATLASAQDAIRRAGLPVPDAAGGVAEGKPTVGLFLVPDNAAPGMIETLCLQSVSDDPVSKCVETFFDCIATQAKRTPINPAKARAQAYLASQKETDYHIGRAADRGTWNFAHPAFAPLETFLRKLAAA